MKKCKHPTCGDVCRRPAKTKEKPTSLKKRTPIAKVSKLRQKRLGERKPQTEADKAFFFSLWEQRLHLSFESKEPLGNEPLNLFFHHVLEKGIRKFKKYRYCDWNIVFLTWQEHDQVDKNLDKLPKTKAYKQFLLSVLEKYGDITEELINKENEKDNTSTFTVDCSIIGT